MPLVLPTNSAKTIRMSDSGRLSRNPANALGSVAGTMSRATRCHRLIRKARAVSNCTRVNRRRPVDRVQQDPGQIVPKTIVATSIWVPSLNSAKNTGAIVTTGNALANAEQRAQVGGHGRGPAKRDPERHADDRGDRQSRS